MPSNVLTGQTPANTYLQLLHIGTGTAGVATIRIGDGTATALSFVSGGVAVAGTFSVSGATTLTGAVTCGGAVTITGNLTVTGALQGNTKLAGPLVFSGVQSLSGAGAVDTTSPVTSFTSTAGSQALTLADGIEGQVKTIVHAVDGGSGILTPTTKTGFTTITFTAAGDSVMLMFLTTRGWCVIGSRGVTIS